VGIEKNPSRSCFSLFKMTWGRSPISYSRFLGVLGGLGGKLFLSF
jgi:hypothetical protein